MACYTDNMPRKPLTPKQLAQKRESDARYRAANRESRRLAEHARRHGPNRQAVLDTQKAYREANAESVAAAKRDWRQRNAEHVSEYNKRYAERNPEKTLEISRRRSHNRRARQRNVEYESFSDAVMLARWGTDCYLCGEGIDLEAPRRCGAVGWERSLWRDHVVALSLGGSGLLDNIRPTHGLCNLRKSNKERRL